MVSRHKNISTFFSIAIAIALMAICIAGLFILPELTDKLIDTRDVIGDRNNVGPAQRGFIHALAYILLILIMVADGFLFVLLRRVRAGKVFTPKSVICIRGVSWCCLLMCLSFCLLGIYFQLAFFVAFGLLFLGVCLRIVKSTVEEATEIKSENDLTV